MTFFDKIFISTYIFSKNRKDETPRVTSSCFVLAMQVFLILLPVLTLKLFFRIRLPSFIPLEHYTLVL